MSPLARKIYGMLMADTMSVPEIHEGLDGYDVSSVRRAVRELDRLGAVEQSGCSANGKLVYWKVAIGTPREKIRTYIRRKPVNMSTSKTDAVVKRGVCGWKDVPKTGERGWGYV